MGKALYRKYRSKRLAEIVGQEHITSTLSRALQTDKISHAYLFTGPRGVGKTSIARILAHELNGFAYTDDAAHLDIIEIDAASNRRIDEIRDLRERVHTAPTSGKYKVYIIDEVHMLTKEAFNALLKTLEEPPAHVIFILATTEAHKLPDTIVSRTQRFAFKPIAATDAVRHLQSIAHSEQLQTTPEALELIAQAGGGSFRDSISLLDQLSATGTVIDESAVRQTLGIIPHEAIDQLQLAVTSLQPASVAQVLRQLRDAGYQATQIAQQLLTHLRQQLVTGQSLSPVVTFQLLDDLLNVPTAHDPETKLELVLLGAVIQHAPTSVTAAAPPDAAVQTSTPAAAPQPAPATNPAKPAPDQTAAPGVSPQPIATVADSDQATEPAAVPAAGQPPAAPALPPDADATAIWQALLDALRAKYNTLYGIARMAEPQFADTTLVLHFGFAFHQKRMNEPKNKQVLITALHGITGQPWTITCLHSSTKPAAPSAPAATAIAATAAPAAQPSPAPEPPAALTTISTIFGGAEVLDS